MPLFVYISPDVIIVYGIEFFCHGQEALKDDVVSTIIIGV